MQSEQAIVASNLTKVYRSRWTGREVRAIDGVSLAVPRGAAYGLLGPNGAGKTTFVKCLLSAVHPTAGAAYVFGRNTADPAARQPIGYLPENHRFPTYFTGEGLLDFYAALSGLPAAERKRRIPRLLDLVGLEQWGRVRIGKYSKGMLQRLGLAQALIHSPQLLVLDEPTDGVDPVGRRHIRDILRQLESQGVTIFINSHLLAEVELFCDEVAILRKGKLVLTGAVRELVAGKGYRLTASGVTERLYDELRARAAAAASRDGYVDFQFTTRQQVNAAVDALRAEDCEIEAIVPTASTLEEVFVQAVEGASEERPEAARA
ncbi:MAG TPA: ABC transporter ATP-binding protein [Bryobacteraceae bacterium]|nr:ABC transporter ATP-binding protein [Bryobacteraceae bacterium]